jgi:pimeloyl-ACP methyl ester carboxylesterase
LSEPATLVFVHGAGGGGWEWRYWARVATAAGHAAVAPDLRPAPAGLAATTLADYRAQVDGWVAAARGEGRPVVLVGASLGGWLAAAATGDVAARVLVNPLPPRGSGAAGAAAAAGAPGPAIRAWGRTASLAGTRAALPDADAFTTLAAWRLWRDESAAVLAEAQAGGALAAPASPSLVIASDDDRDVPAGDSARLAAAWRADLHRVPGSHVGPLLGRDAAAIAAHAVAWLNVALRGRRVQPQLGTVTPISAHAGPGVRSTP